MKPRKIIELQLRILAPKRLFGYCGERIGALGFTKLTKIKNSSSRVVEGAILIKMGILVGPIPYRDLQACQKKIRNLLARKLLP